MAAESGISLEGQRVVISGATGDLGRLLAARFASAGASLVLIDLETAALGRLAAEVGGAETVLCDQTDNAAIASACERIGVPDIFINNAGIIFRKPLLDHSHQEMDTLFAVNATGAIKMAIGMARAMRPDTGGRGGTIVNIATQHAFSGGAGRGVYAASKAAIVQFTKAAGVEWAPHGIRVFGVAPGPVANSMTADARKSPDYCNAVVERMPIRRFLEGCEIVELIFSLAQPAMSALVGATVVADGGGMLT